MERVESQGVKLMITHNCQSCTIGHHGHHDVQHCRLVYTPVNKVAKKNGLARGVLKVATGFNVIHEAQQLPQVIRMTVDIANYVVTLCYMTAPGSENANTRGVAAIY